MALILIADDDGDQAAATEEKIASWEKRNSARALAAAKTAIDGLIAALNVDEEPQNASQVREA